MPAPITARAMNPTRHSKGSVLVYSASPPHTPPSTLLVVLRRSRRCGTPAAGAGGAGCQDGWSARDGLPEGRSEPGGSGNGAAVMERRLSPAGAREHGTRSRRTPVIGPGRSCLTRGASDSPSPPPRRDPGRYSRDLPVDREITSFITRSPTRRRAGRGHVGPRAVEAGVEVLLRAVGQRPRSSRVAVAQREGGSRRGGVTALPAESGVLVSRADARVGTEKPGKEIVQQMLRGPVQMLGVAIPRMAVGLAAVPPEPLADDREAIDRDAGRTGGRIGHRDTFPRLSVAPYPTAGNKLGKV